ncbi:hypothetical protein [Pseudoalteromonas mariniglutinosa]|uniref:hypothetical protein n=1 Tax=Pseudoalteromonas mariniglutinosa TaxID=206042 RepID=UPI0038510943
MNRTQALAEFVTFGEHKDEAIGVIVSASSSERTLIYSVTLATVLDVLKRCLAGEIEIDDLALWANVIESRSDIDHSAVEGMIYALSNSEQMGELNLNKIQRLISVLGKA